MSSNLRNMFTVSPKDLPNHMAKLFGANLVPFVRSSPGRGKSAIMSQFAKDYDLEFIDIRLSMYEVTDFVGLPFRDKDKTRYLPVDLFPLDDEEIPEGKNGWLILLDEFTHAEPEMIRASYKLILDRMVGQRKLHPNAFIALAGNNVDDNALANNVGTALNNRVTHLILGSDADYWTQEIATKFGFDHRIVGFISMNKDKLNDFNPEQDEHGYCTERSWEFVSRIISGSTDVNNLAPLIAGTISPGTAAEFVQFCDIYKNLISIKDVIKDPENCKIPDDSPTTWALTTHLAKEASVNNAKELAIYMERFPIQYCVIFLKLMDGSLRSNKDIMKLYRRMGRILS